GRGGFYVYLETIGGGAGGAARADGLDGVQVHVTNTSNLPVECLETEYPLLVDEYALVEGSGGAGRRRGGMGIRRAIEVLGHEARRRRRGGGGPQGIALFRHSCARARRGLFSRHYGVPGQRARVVPPNA